MANTRKATGPKATKAPELDDFVPIVIDTSTPTVDADRVPVFIIDGVEHTIPRRLPAGDTIRSLEVIATQGAVAGAWFMVKRALTEDSINALMESKHVTHEQVRSIFDRIGKMYMGQVEDLAGK